ncbi:hypothetical protein [Streptomyces sp. YIM S03343]
MSGEVVFVALYSVVLLVVVGVLEFYGSQPTSAWASQVFAGYRRAVPDAPEPAEQTDWPHSEVGRFHRVLSAFVSVIAVLLVAATLLFHHRLLEALALIAAGGPHALIAYRLLRRLRRAPAGSTAAGAPAPDAGVRDAGVRDASVRDASVRDASVRDASGADRGATPGPSGVTHGPNRPDFPQQGP